MPKLTYLVLIIVTILVSDFIQVYSYLSVPLEFTSIEECFNETRFDL